MPNSSITPSATSPGTPRELRPAPRDTDKKRRERTVLICLFAGLIVIALVSLIVGRYGISPARLWHIMAAKLGGGEIAQADKQAAVVLFVVRIPRILLCIMVGAALAASGAAYQGLFKNPLVSPDILGVSSGAGVGAALGLLLSMPTLGVHLTSFIFGISAVVMVMAIAGLVGRGNGTLLIMILAGVIISSVFSATTSFIKYMADAEEKLPEITFWLMGSFARSGSYRNVFIMLGVMCVGALPLYLLRWKINVLTFGDEEAQAMGIHVKKLRLIIISCSTLLTASSVCLCGTIGWVGLIIPHMARFVIGPNYRTMLPAAMLTGALFMLIVDNVSRVIIPGELPVSILTSFIGAPLFIYLLFRSRRELS